MGSPPEDRGARVAPGTPPRDVTRQLTRLRRISYLMEDLVVVPVLGLRFGLDALLGLIPGLGDAFGGLVTFSGIALAASAGAPAPVLARMLLNLMIDLTVGSVPLVGDAFDFAWKSNRMNLALFERWVADPRGSHRASRWLLAAGAMAIAVMALGALAFGVWLLRHLWLAIR